MSDQQPTPDRLEQWLTRQVQSLPLRSAPRTLSTRVMTELQRRAALPWWRKSFLCWPVSAQMALVAACLGLANISVGLLRWLNVAPRGEELSVLIDRPVTWLEWFASALHGAQAFCELLLRHLPSVWLYGGLLTVLLLYATLCGIGAAAYRTLYADR